MSKLQNIVRMASLALNVAGGIMLLMMMLHVVADVSGRYLFGKPLPATIQIVAWYYMVCVAYLPVAWVQLNRGHLQVELFTMKLPPRGIAALNTLVDLGSAAFTGLMTWLVLNDAIRSTARGEAQDATFFDLPIWPVTWVLPLSFGLMALVFAMQAALDGTFALTGRKPAAADQRSGTGAAPVHG